MHTAALTLNCQSTAAGGVLLPKALLRSFAFDGPNHGDLHLIGMAFALGGLEQSCSQVRDRASALAPALVV